MSRLRTCAALAAVVLGCAGPTDARAAVVWAVGDGDGRPGSDRVVGLIERDPPYRFLYLGDVYGGFATNYAPTFGRLKAITLPTPGNHHSESGYRAYWNRPSNYSVTIEGWRVISLNSDGLNLRFLRSRLGSGTCRLVMTHHPRYTAGSYAPGDRRLEKAWRMAEGHARLWLSGHDHNMQQLVRRRGITQLISGAGGRSHYKIDFGAQQLVFGNDTQYGALRLDLQPSRASWQFVTSTGRVLHRDAARCRGPA